MLGEIAKIIENPSFDKKKILQNIERQIVGIKNNIANNGNSVAQKRAFSKISKKYLLFEKISGLDYLFFLQDLKKNISKDFSFFEKKMNDIFEKVFSEKNLSVLETSFLNDKKSYKKLNLKNKKNKKNNFDFEVKKESEGIVFGNLENSFNAVAGKTKNKKNLHKISLVKKFLTYGYLWEKIREQGGAYGSRFASFAEDNIYGASSYMDSRISGTYDDFEKIGNFLEEKEFSEKEIDSMICSFLSDNFNPKNIFSQNYSEFLKDFSGKDFEYQKNIFEFKKELNDKDIKDFAKIWKKSFENIVKVSIGSSQKIKKNKKIFDKIIYIK